MLAIRGAFSRFFAADGFFLSAGLAFFLMVTMIPVVLIGVSIVGFVVSSHQAANEVVDELAQNFPVYRREIRAVVLRIVETRASSGVLGTVVLIMFATPLFSTARLVLHRLLGVRAPKEYFRNLVIDAGMVVLLGVLVLLATLATWVFHWIRVFVLEPALERSHWIDTANVVFSVVLSAGMFYLGYRYVPRRGVRTSAALVGAIVASLLWEVAKELFSLYIRNVSLYDRIYGPLGVLVAFVMFVYYSAIVFVFGGSYVAALDLRRR